MSHMILLAALLLGSAAPAVTDGSDQAKQREAQNWDVLFSQYPPESLARGEQGLVGFKVSLDRDGYATVCEVTHSSGYSRLDSETCRLIMNRAQFKGIRGSDGRSVSSVREGVVNWKLPTSPHDAAQAVPVALAKADAPEKLICRRKLRTGSLADFERVCATRADWQRLANRIQEEWGELQGTKGSTHGN